MLDTPAVVPVFIDKIITAQVLPSTPKHFDLPFGDSLAGVTDVVCRAQGFSSAPPQVNLVLYAYVSHPAFTRL